MLTREKSIVYTPSWIGPLQVKNRLVPFSNINASTTGGEVSEFLVELYRNLAKGGVGLIITSLAGVYSKALPYHLSIRADEDSFHSESQKRSPNGPPT